MASRPSCRNNSYDVARVTTPRTTTGSASLAFSGVSARISRMSVRGGRPEATASAAWTTPALQARASNATRRGRARRRGEWKEGTDMLRGKQLGAPDGESISITGKAQGTFWMSGSGFSRGGRNASGAGTRVPAPRGFHLYDGAGLTQYSGPEFVTIDLRS